MEIRGRNVVAVEDIISSEPKAEADWSAACNSHLRLGIPAIWPKTLGEGIRVAVLDSGVDVTHPLLLPRVVAMRSFVPGEHAFMDQTGHGTHCAGIILGEPLFFSNNNQYVAMGLAPQAQLLVGKVLDRHGSGSNKALCEGTSWT
jgi:subtilisin family serine protease